MTVASDRPRRIGTWALTGVAVAAALGFLAWRLFGVSDGAVISFYADAWSPAGAKVQVETGTPDGLRDGDLVTGVAGHGLNEWLGSAIIGGFDRLPSGASSVPYSVVREGTAVEVRVGVGRVDVGQALLANWSVLVFTVVLQAIAGFVLLRRPEASAAVALSIAAVGVTGSTLPWLLGLGIRDITEGWPFVLYALTAGGLYMLLWPAGALHLPLAMASIDGAPPRRTLQLVYAVPLGAYLAGLVVARVASPSATAWLGTWPAVQALTIIPTIVMGLILSIRAFRLAPPDVRLRLRWALIGGIVSSAGGLVLLLGPQLLTGRPIVPWSAVGLLALPLPVGLAAGILRHQLFDIEVIVNRTLVYGGVTGSIVAIYAGSVAILGTLIGSDTGISAPLLGTGLAAVAALPIRDGLQRTVNRLMYGDRDDPSRAITRLGQRLEATLDPIEAPEIIVRTIAESLRLPWVGLRVGPTGRGGRLVTTGQPPAGDPMTVTLVYGAETVGELLVSPRSGGEPLSAADRQLLEALARQAGVAVRAFALTTDLIDSRGRLVAAREEERRRIRRDLHDGLGPSLAAIGMRAEVAADLVTSDPAGARTMLAQLHGEVQSALGDIRRLVDALRPPALDELGLVGALRAQGERLGPRPQFLVEASERFPELPAAVEVAAYRIAVEAMTNAARHAEASSCVVKLAISTRETAGDQILEVEVSDDGRGLPSALRPGIGLLSMRERAAEVGGICEIGPGPVSGTLVRAALPVSGANTGHEDSE